MLLARRKLGEANVAVLPLRSDAEAIRYCRSGHVIQPTPAVTIPLSQRFITLSQPQLPHPAGQRLPPLQLHGTAISLPFKSQP